MSATFKVECPACNASIRVPLGAVGTKAACPGCGQRILIPDQRNKTMLARLPGEVSISTAPMQPIVADLVEQSEDRPLEPHRGTAILVMGIMSLFILPFIFGPITWLWAKEDLRKMKLGRMDLEGKGNTEAGRLMAIIATILGMIMVGLTVLYCTGIWLLMASTRAGVQRF